MNKAKLCTLLGFAQKSNNLISGQELVYKSLGKKYIGVVLIGANISEQSGEKITWKCRRLNIPIVTTLTTEELSQAIGKHNRTVIALTDSNFSQSIVDLISDMGTK